MQQAPQWDLFQGDALELLKLAPANSVDCCITSPPYWGLRDYGQEGQLGLEATPYEYVDKLVNVFREVRRVLKNDGTLWLNIGDSYVNSPSSAVNRDGMSGSLNNGKSEFACREGTRGSQQRKAIPLGLKVKDLVGIPWMLAFALRSDGWYLRSDVIWHKNNPMPESVTDRPTKAHEYVFLLTKNQKYFYDADVIKEPYVSIQTGAAGTFRRDGSKREQAIPGQSVGTHRPDRQDDVYGHQGKNKRSVWSINVKPFRGAHFAVMPEALVEPCVLAGSHIGGTVLDPFAGSGTVGVVAGRHGRNFIGIELNPDYCKLAEQRIKESMEKK